MVFKRLFDVLRSYTGDMLEGDGKRDWGKTEWEEYKKYKKTMDDQAADEEWEPNIKPPVAKEKKYFGYLEMEPTKDFTLIKKQYRKMMKKYHPDRYTETDKKRDIAEEITRQLNEAYEYFEDKYEGK